MNLAPNWAMSALGKIVVMSCDGDGYAKGQRGMLISIRSKHPWGQRGAYATVALNLADVSDEENVDLEHIEPTVDRSYSIDKRPGGGWRLTLVEDGEEVGFAIAITQEELEYIQQQGEEFVG